MKTLLLNGSPRKEHSNTFKIANAFMAGLCAYNEHDINKVIISEQNIKPCNGCFGCWYKTPEICVLSDDMGELLIQYQEADLIIWSFPLYFFGMPSGLKAFMDRLVPRCLPNILEKTEGGAYHPSRFGAKSQKHVLISTCGFHSGVNNYEALEKQFEIIFGTSLVKILCPMGGIFGAKEPSRLVRKYLDKARHAGEEYITTGTLSIETQSDLSQPVFDPKDYMTVHNILCETKGQDKTADLSQPVNEEALSFMRQMLLEFTPQTTGKTETTIEIYFTDLGNTYQFRVTDGSCQLHTGSGKDYTTRIEIDFSVWKEIALRRLSISQAFIGRKYRMLGDYDSILRFDDFFPILP